MIGVKSRKAKKPKDTKMTIGRLTSKDGVTRSVIVDGGGGKDIKKVGGHIKYLYPKG